ncbi:MAG: hypothetical protein IJD13_02890 [Oscillospiraceae bacterium]|nr:hypothetical protein [Oscillospiraceae bacterium]
MAEIFESIRNFFGRMAVAVRRISPKKAKEADVPSEGTASRETAFAEVAHRVIEDVRKV